MDRIVVDTDGEAEASLSQNRFEHVRFPLCLALEYGDTVEECPDFVLNIDRGEVVIRKGLPLEEGSTVLLHFYIPPREKLLGEFKGKVKKVEVDRGKVYVKITGRNKRGLERLDEYLMGKRHLVDKEI